MERELTLDEALAEVLRVLDAGGDVDLDWLRRRFPKHWQDLHQTLVLMSWLEPEHAHPDEEAAIVAGRWSLVEPIGEGGAGVAWRARAIDGGEDVCVKILRPELAARRGAFERFLREVRLGVGIAHPNVVRVLDAGTCRFEGRRTAFLAMELVEGATLRDRMRAQRTWSEGVVVATGLDLARGLRAIHEADAVHRDLKPENVLCDRDGRARITDLGVAHADDLVRSRAAFLGTPRYAAPEQFASRRTVVDARADLFALGAILYELLRGLPLRAASARGDVIASAVVTAPGSLELPDSELGGLVRRLVAPHPDDRPASADSVVALLEGIGSRPTGHDAQGPDSGLPPLLRGRRRIPLVGRAREMSHVRAALDASNNGRPRVVLVRGPGGVGKSRIVAEVAAHAVALGRTVAAARAADLDALRNMLSGAHESVDGERALFVVEDLHDGPAECRAQFSVAARALRDLGHVVVGTVRPAGPGTPADLPEWWLHATAVDEFDPLDLTALDSETSLQLFRAVAGDDARVSVDRDALLAAAGGLPLAVALAAEHAAGTRPAGTSVTRIAARSDVDVPVAVLEAIDDQLSRLPAADRDLVRLAAIAGLDDEELLATVCDRPVERLREELSRIAEPATLLVQRGRRVEFVHELVREAVEALAPAETLGRLHGRVAKEVAERAGGEPEGADALRLVRHLLAAGELDKTVPHAFRALEHLRLTNLPAEQIALSERLLSAGIDDSSAWRLRLLIVHGQAARLLMRHEEGDTSLSEALELSHHVPPRGRLHCLNVYLGNAISRGRLEESRPLVAEMEELAEAHGGVEERCFAFRLAALYGLAAGERGLVERCMEGFSALVEPDEISMRRLLLHRLRARLANQRGDVDVELAELETVEDIARGIGNANAAASIRAQRAAALMQRARVADALSVLVEGIAEARRASRAQEVTYLLRLQGYLLGWCGDVASARRNFTVAARVYEQCGQHSARGESLAGLAVAEARLGDPEAARAAARDALRVVSKKGSASLVAGVLDAVASVAAARGRAASARRLAALSAEIAARAGIESTRVSATLRRAVLDGRYGEARTLLDAADAPLFGFATVEHATALWRATRASEDLDRARAAVRRFLGACPAELRERAQNDAPEIADVLRA